MPLRFRSIVPYTLPGVLALIGWWWYISRKKERITNHDSEEGAAAMGLLTSPALSEGSNGLVEKGTVSPCTTPTTSSSSCRARTASSRVRPSKAKEQRSTEQDVVAQIHIPAIKAEAVEVQSTSCSPTERASHHPDRASAVTDPGVDSCRQTSRSSSPPTSPLPTQTREESSGPPGEHWATVQSPPATIALVTVPVKSTVTEQVPAPVKEAISTASEALVLSQTAHATTSSSIAADLTNAERPDPEGEVAAAHEAAVAFTQNLLVQLVAKDSLPVPSSSTKDELPSSPVISAEMPARALKVVIHEPLFPETPTSLQGSYHAVITSTLASPAQGHQQEKGAPGSTEELEYLAAGLITEVISAATQEVLSVTSCPETWLGQSATEHSFRSTPLANGRPCSEQEPLTRNMEEGPSPISHAETEWREQQEEGMPNGCPPAPAWEQMGTAKALSNPWATASCKEGREEVRGMPSNLDKLKGDDGVMVAEDSACSTCHSEDGVSSEDQQSRESREDLIQVSGMSEGEGGLPQAPEEVVTEAEVMAALPGHVLGAVGQVKRLNGMGLRNGSHGMSETETDQSGGSDVNSMDSVDSGFTMGARDSGSPAMALGSELIVWEIEVPKHLVGRLIGKQGRYVSFLKQSSGAKIYISTLPYTQEFQICHIEGSQLQVDKALSLIGKKFKDLDLTNLYAPPPLPLTLPSLPSLPMTTWLLLPSGVTVEVIVVNIVSAGHLFVQQHTHPTYHALRSLDQQMFLCYSQPDTPTLPSPAEVGVICAAPAVEGAWWRAQVISFYKDTNEVEIRYVDYGGYDRVKIDTLRQIRSDFVTLPFQGAEVLLDNIAPLPGEKSFSTEATSALEEMTRGVALLAQVTNYDNNTGLPLVQMWNMVGEELLSVNRTLAERALSTWVDSF
ncbi:A-kinase anchor protein 1, mitochondrial-like [Salvelinus namaycush]|uniref:A-kinase anchor protein 1, mitochondrial-like n=1 Tax=Salvelinus namaycush TaxID=8040 RepID=A0A8U0TIN8_SALNM|nr:A-kinase anchor protein 1, mitochondrial-like [Salvelinus namaycush]XP_038817039.1 A-kinase anchor protein 1, mitochondrial-like [Salvelinus namaycush]